MAHYEVEVPLWLGRALAVFAPLVKGAGHKYIRRVVVGTTKTGRPRYRYYYKVTGGAGLGHDDELHEGAAFRIKHGDKEGHFHIVRVEPDGTLIVKHDESGWEGPVARETLRSMLHEEHAEAIGKARERARADLEAARKHGSTKQIEARKREAEALGVTDPRPKVVAVSESEPSPAPDSVPTKVSTTMAELLRQAPKQESKYRDRLDTAEIAKLVRADLKTALPPGVKTTVRIDRYSMGSSINVRIVEAPFAILNPANVKFQQEHPNEAWHTLPDSDPASRRFTPDGEALVKIADKTLRAYLRDRSDSQTDYYNVNFAAHAAVDHELESAERKAILAGTFDKPLSLDAAIAAAPAKLAEKRAAVAPKAAKEAPQAPAAAPATVYATQTKSGKAAWAHKPTERVDRDRFRELAADGRDSGVWFADGAWTAKDKGKLVAWLGKHGMGGGAGAEAAPRVEAKPAEVVSAPRAEPRPAVAAKPAEPKRAPVEGHPRWEQTTEENPRGGMRRIYVRPLDDGGSFKVHAHKDSAGRYMGWQMTRLDASGKVLRTDPVRGDIGTIGKAIKEVESSARYFDEEHKKRAGRSEDQYRQDQRIVNDVNAKIGQIRHIGGDVPASVHDDIASARRLVTGQDPPGFAAARAAGQRAVDRLTEAFQAARESYVKQEAASIKPPPKTQHFKATTPAEIEKAASERTSGWHSTYKLVSTQPGGRVSVHKLENAKSSERAWLVAETKYNGDTETHRFGTKRDAEAYAKDLDAAYGAQKPHEQELERLLQTARHYAGQWHDKFSNSTERLVGNALSDLGYDIGPRTRSYVYPGETYSATSEAGRGIKPMTGAGLAQYVERVRAIVQQAEKVASGHALRDDEPLVKSFSRARRPVRYFIRASA